MSKLQLAIVLPQSICKWGASNTRACHKSGEKRVQLPLESKAFLLLLRLSQELTWLHQKGKEASREKKQPKQKTNQYDVSCLYLCCINPDQSVWILCFWRYNMLNLSILSGFSLKNRGFFFFFSWQSRRFYSCYSGFKTGLLHKKYCFSLYTTISFLNCFSITYSEASHNS